VAGLIRAAHNAMNRAPEPTRHIGSSQPAMDGAEETYSTTREKFDIQGIKYIFYFAVKDNRSWTPAEKEANRFFAHINQQ
jgi:ribosome biogenesis SPOUT family RNA methylase Rps3